MIVDLQYEEKRIFALDASGRVVAEITYPLEASGVVSIDHTFVDESLRGQGIADTLMRAAVAKIREAGLKAVADCSYAQIWFARHPDETDVLLKECPT